MIRDPGWSENFQRLVLSCAVNGDLMSRMPAAVQPALFGSASGSTNQSPRQRIAAALADYSARYASRPSPAVLEEVMRRVGERLGEAERAELARETERVLTAEVVEDPSFVYDQVREWAEYSAIANGLLRAADLIDAGPSALPAVRDLLAKSAEPVSSDAGRVRTLDYIAGAPERLANWRVGDDYGERIATGFGELDRVLAGGPTRGESWYFLAPPKGAKTASLLKVARHASKRRFGVLVQTFEMRALRMALRLDRMSARQSKEEIREDLTRLEKAMDGLRLSGAGEITIDEVPPQTPNCVQAAARRVESLRRAGKVVDVVVLDYLNIMGSAREEREKRHELAKISREISAFGKNEGVLTWSAALLKRTAVNKRVIRKDDIAEAYEVISVMDGGVAICATREMVANGYRRFYVTAAREEADEVRAGDYKVDFARMTIDPASEDEVDAVLDKSDSGEQGD